MSIRGVIDAGYLRGDFGALSIGRVVIRVCVLGLSLDSSFRLLEGRSVVLWKSQTDILLPYARLDCVCNPEKLSRVHSDIFDNAGGLGFSSLSGLQSSMR